MQGFLIIIVGTNIIAQDDFSKTVDALIKKELRSIPKPPANLKLTRGEFETTKEFESRVKRVKAKQKKEIVKYNTKVQIATDKAQKKAIKKALQYTWGKPILSKLKYDADNGYFVARLTFENKKSFDKKVAIKVKRKYARDFKSKFSTLKPQAIFDYDGQSVSLKDIKVPYKSMSFLAQFTDMSVDDTRVAVNISNEFDTPKATKTKITVAKNSMSNFDASKLTDYKVLDRLLAKSSQKGVDSTKWLFVVGIEQYEFTDNINYAQRSATMFKKVMKKKLGIKESNCYTMINGGATQAKIKTNLKKMLRRVKTGDTIYFYYNGHGVPVPNKKYEPYMLTSDTEPDFVGDEDFFALKNIYGKLSASKAKKVVAVVDSCFSGVTDGKSVLKGVAATKMKPRLVNFDKDKMVVLAAGKGHQYSNGYDKKGYRLFSFYIMKNILEGKEDVRSLYKSTKKETYQTSLEEYGDSRTQEPTVDGNFRMKL
ncbi:MAG: caspase family protein [Sulfurimonas sp.]|nr:caspase family protein [Sulfurimonas sp.]